MGVCQQRGTVVQRGHRMVIGDEIISTALGLETDRRFHGTEKIADVKFAGWLESREDAHGRSMQAGWFFFKDWIAKFVLRVDLTDQYEQRGASHGEECNKLAAS